MNFYTVHNPLSDTYRNSLGARYHSMKTALNLFFQNKGVTIVETGTTRQENDWGAGMSTFVFLEAIKMMRTEEYSPELFTVDISADNIDMCRKICGADKAITYVVDDALHFLKESCPPQIDLLYLDSLDYPLGGTAHAVKQCQEHQLKEFKLAENQLAKHAVVLLDDNDFPDGGKTKITKNYLYTNGWTILIDDQQSLWTRF